MNPQWLLSPWSITAGLLAGGAAGICLPEISRNFAPFGDAYLRLLQMCVLPIMITAIITSLAKLLTSGMTGRVLGRILLILGIGLILASLLGLLSGLIGKPGADLSQGAREVIGSLISGQGQEKAFDPDMKLSFDKEYQEKSKPPGEFLKEVIPENIFKALLQGQTVQILFFALLTGVAMSFISGQMRDKLVDNLEAIFQTFILIIHWLMYLLPLAIFFLIASQLAELGVEVLGAMARYIVWVYAACFLLVLINALAMAASTGQGFLRTFKLLKEPLIISFFTRNSYAAMPSAIEALRDSFRIDKDTTNLVIPLGITICRFGTVLVFALSTVFMAQLFNVQLDALNILFIAFASVVAGIAAAGAPGVVALTMISIVLEPLGLPLEVALVLLLAVDPITDPPLTLINVQTNCAACSLIQNN